MCPYRSGQETEVRAIHLAGRMGDRRHAAGARHEGDRRAGGQGADDGADVAAAVRAGLVPRRPRALRAQEHHVRDRHQAGVLALARHRRRRARRRHAEQPRLPAVHRRRAAPARAPAAPVVRGGRPRGVPHPRVRQDAHLHTHRTPPPPSLSRP